MLRATSGVSGQSSGSAGASARAGAASAGIGGAATGASAAGSGKPVIMDQLANQDELVELEKVSPRVLRFVLRGHLRITG